MVPVPPLVPHAHLWSIVHENEIRKLLLIPPIPICAGSLARVCKSLVHRIYLALY